MSTLTNSHQIPEIFSPFTSIVAAQSTRHGGVSPAPYSSLNIGLYTPDEQTNVDENRDRFFGALGVQESQIAGSFQVHQDQVKMVNQPEQVEGYDALITNKKNIFLTVTVADCVPILIYDAKQEVVAAIHAGWRGTVVQIVRKTLNKMQLQFQTKGPDCYAFIGTCIDLCSFEVGPEVSDQFAEAYKEWDEGRQKFRVDLKESNKAQLLGFDVPESQIEVSPFDTMTHNDTFFSHRKEAGKTGRMLAVIGMKD